MSKTIEQSEVFLTPNEVSKRANVDLDMVYSWIRSKELVATDVSRKGSRKKLWRIAPEAFNRFVAARSSVGPVPTPRRPRREPFKKYF